MEVPHRALHGGAGRVTALAARSSGYTSALACLVEPGGAGRPSLRVITHHGEGRESLLLSAAEVLAGRRAGPSYVGSPLFDVAGTVVGVLCLGGPPEGRDTAADLEPVAAFAEVLSDQLDLIRTLGPPPDPTAVARLRAALADGEVQAWFQPLVDLADHRLVGFEALARWTSADGTVTSPGEFVPLAEQSGLVADLDLAVLRAGLDHLARWQKTDPDLRLSVNISGRHLDRTGWMEEVAGCVDAAGVEPRTVELELTESVRPSDVVRNADELSRARELGFEVWFDDFGTGWAELRQLVELPVDGVKVDRFFTEKLGGRGDTVVRAVLTMADELGLDTVIEGISTADHAERAQALGGRLGQGFWWSPAVPAEQVDAVLAGDSDAFSPGDR
ncbi:EAL domain-containing protein [Nocardioides sp. CFH 31398]|uniref:EAL domain-containing protein n=1 Tax=Nocardioides sp. CFH 31398 TaxID=2919579 RepID=UPI001F053FAE|nr:EAL domain-containing protein [Nocardioides sp. CFH 31398]MCH1867242.1 EAL domain-containing protein [Nocardioides sp. CFH 31398]